MKTVEVSYFYPTSPLSRSYKMPKGGYAVKVPGVCETAFTNKEDAFRYAEESGFPYGRFSLQPQFPQSCEALEQVRAAKRTMTEGNEHVFESLRHMHQTTY
jgi:hypothetical protein